MTDSLFRCCFNFQDRCSLSCSYCYIPFGKGIVDHSLSVEIVLRMREIGFNVVTFGGGDPFQYRDIVSLFERTKESGALVHVDTNGLGYFSDLIKDASPYIDLISFPLDGPSEAMHDFMRSSPGNFQRIIRSINKASSLSMITKINTVVSGVNYHSIIDMPSLINDIRPLFWNLYQYWPLVENYHINGSHVISSDLFCYSTEDIVSSTPLVAVEVASIERRVGHYFFVSHRGTVYTHLDSSAYIEIGSIFDRDIVERWNHISKDTVRVGALQRYASAFKDQIQ